MSNTPDTAVISMLQSLDSGDRDAVVNSFDDDAQGIDELSRAWLRGADQMRAYIDGIFAATSNVRSRLVDVHVTEIGDAAFVTGILAQEYDLAGERQVISVPTTFGLRRTDGIWRVCLFHSVPLPE